MQRDMHKTIEHWLRLDRSDDIHARSLAIKFYVAAVFACIISGVLTFLQLLDGSAKGDGVVIASLLFSLGMLLLVWLGYLNVLRWIFPALIYGIITIMAVINFGLFDEAIYAYPLLIALAGTLAGRRGVVVFTLISLGTVAAIGYAGIHGAAPYYSGSVSMMRAWLIAVLFLGAGGFIYTMVSDLLSGQRSLQSSEQALRQTNRQLESAQATLEAQVRERTRRADEARRQADEARHAVETQAWLAGGLAQLSEVMSGDQETAGLAEKVLKQICQYLELPKGGLFIMQDGALTCFSRYPRTQSEANEDTMVQRFRQGDGTVGLAARDKRILILQQDRPQGTAEEATNGLPTWIVSVPLLTNRDDVIGVLELGSELALTPQRLRFLEVANRNIAVAFQTAEACARSDELLAEMQSQAEEMRSREEELRAINEALEARAQALRARLAQA